MAVIPQTSTLQSFRTAITPTTLTASDTLAYQQGIGQMLVLINNTAGSLTPVITGSAAPTAFGAPGGPLAVSLAAGFSMAAMAAGVTRVILLDNIAQFLPGIVTVTGATGMTAILFADA